VPPFAEACARSDKSDAARVEQAADRTGIHRFRDVGRLPFRSDDDQRIHGLDRAVRTGQERVDVDFNYLRKIHSQSRQTHEYRDNRIPVDRCLPAESPQQLRAPQLVNHLQSFVRVQRRETESDVIKDFRECPAQTEHDDRTELSIPKQAGNKLSFPLHHRLDEECLQIAAGGAGDLRRRR